jgi:hypothetical protein
MNQFYDIEEWWITRNTIEWQRNKKLTWEDFNYDPSFQKKLYARVGIANRFNLENPLSIRTKTLFIPNESFISDTTDQRILKAAQLKWSLLEIYRRKMVKEFDSLKSINKKFSVEDMDKLSDKFYEKFEAEWVSYHGSLDIDKTLNQLEDRVNKVLNQPFD